MCLWRTVIKLRVQKQIQASMVNSSVTKKGRIYKGEQEGAFSKCPWKNRTATSKEFYWFLSHTTWISVKHVNPKTDVMRFLEISIGRRLLNIRVSFTFGGQKQKWVSLQVREAGKQGTPMGFHPIEQLCNGKAKHSQIKKIVNRTWETTCKSCVW